ncbi:MAG: hypothetical protein ACYDIB_07350 [Desulfobulbia bacterium]
MKWIRWALTAIGIAGAMLNAFKIGFCFTLWTIGNVGWIVVNVRRRHVQEAMLFTAYLITSVIGLFMWGK